MQAVALSVFVSLSVKLTRCCCVLTGIVDRVHSEAAAEPARLASEVAGPARQGRAVPHR